MEPKLQTNTAAFQEGLEFGRPFSLTKLALMCSVYRAFLCFLRQAVAMQAGDFTNAINVYTEAMGGLWRTFGTSSATLPRPRHAKATKASEPSRPCS